MFSLHPVSIDGFPFLSVETLTAIRAMIDISILLVLFHTKGPCCQVSLGATSRAEDAIGDVHASGSNLDIPDGEHA